MTSRRLLSALAAVLLACSACRAPGATTAAPAVQATGTRVDASLVTPDGRTRTYRVYLPSSLPRSEPVPLLVALHGGLGSGPQFEANSGFDEIAEANAFIVAYPDGIGAGLDPSALRTWNGGACCGGAARQGVDDVDFVRRLIDRIESEHAVDPTRVFAAGHSNGAILAYRLACELADRIVAVGLQAGSLEIDACVPARPVSLLHIHGSADQNLPLDGGVGSNSLAGVDFRAARWSVASLAGAIGCTGLPVTTGDASNADLERTEWAGCPAKARVELLVVAGAGHAWMGHPATSPAAELLVGRPYAGLDASLAIWTFLAGSARLTGG